MSLELRYQSLGAFPTRNVSYKIYSHFYSNSSMIKSKFRKLDGQHVLIIGGTSGIGFAVAQGSIESGASVTICSSNPTRVNAAKKSLLASYPSAIVAGYACDLSQPTPERDIENLFAQTGKIDHVVFTAGGRVDTTGLQQYTLQSIITAGQVRFFAPLLVAKVAMQYLAPGPRASIILTTGTVAEHPAPDWTVVASYAAGLHGMTRNLALDLKPVRVNLVSPGLVTTEFLGSYEGEGKRGPFQVDGDEGADRKDWEAGGRGGGVFVVDEG